VLWTRGGGGHPIFLLPPLPSRSNTRFFIAQASSLFPITQHNPQHLLASLAK